MTSQDKFESFKNLNMSSMSIYPVPILIVDTDFDNEEQSLAHKEMIETYKICKSKGWFKHRNGWNGRQKLSDPTFMGSIIEQVSCTNFVRHLEKCINAYAFVVGARYDQIIINESWLTSSSKGEYSHAHSHGTSHISIAYYIKTTGNDGNFFIQNNNRELESNPFFTQLTQNLQIQPVEGKMILFPSSLLHGVEPNTTDDERVSLSLNIEVKRPAKPDINPYES